MSKYLPILFLLLILAAGCSKDEQNDDNIVPPPTTKPIPDPKPDPKPDPVVEGQSISGKITVYNSKLRLGIGNDVRVELHKDGKMVKYTTSDKDGKYTLTNVPVGTYTIVMLKKGYYNARIRKVYIKECSYTVVKNTPLTADLKLYKKATASVKEISWRQGSEAKGDASNGVVLDITFKNLNMSEIDEYVYLYIFAGYNDQISKENGKEKLDSKDGNGWVPGYANAWIRKSAIVDNKVKGYWDSRVCAWMGGSLHGANTPPTHMAVYTLNMLNAGVDGLFDNNGDNVTMGENYSGIGEIRLIERY